MSAATITQDTTYGAPPVLPPVPRNERSDIVKRLQQRVRSGIAPPQQRPQGPLPLPPTAIEDEKDGNGNRMLVALAGLGVALLLYVMSHKKEEPAQEEDLPPQGAPGGVQYGPPVLPMPMVGVPSNALSSIPSTADPNNPAAGAPAQTPQSTSSPVRTQPWTTGPIVGLQALARPPRS